MSMYSESERAGRGTPAVETAADDTESRQIIQVENLRKVYGSGDAAVTAIDGVSFSIEAGTVVGLLGPNGAGKTTTIKSMLGLVVPTDGRVLFDGTDVHADPSVAYQRLGAMLEGARNVYWRLSVRENLRFFAALAGKSPKRCTARHDALLEQFGLDEKADTPVRELSRGQKQKVSLACTLARDADVIFLDEPTLGLDVESSLELRSELRRLVENSGTTVLLSSHDMDVIEAVCDRVIIVNDGQIVADNSVEDLLEFFDTQTYEVSVDGQLGDGVWRQLRRRFDVSDFSTRPEESTFTVNVTGDEFYEFVDELRAATVSIESINAIDPDLEEIFLHLTEDGDTDRLDGDPSSIRGGADD